MIALISGNTSVKNLRTYYLDMTLEIFTSSRNLKSCDIIKHFWDTKNYKYDRRSLAIQVCALKKSHLIPAALELLVPVLL